MNKYVAGFLFCFGEVALIQKKRPEWQKGLWNGIGGKIEDGEFTDHAMYREFLEEAGHNTPIDSWKWFASLTATDGGSTVYFHKRRVISKPVLRTMTDEPVKWWKIKELETIPLVPNLRWLIPLALYGNDSADIISFIYDPTKKGDF